MDAFDEDKTLPDTRAARAQRISSQSAVDAVELLLGRLAAEEDHDKRAQLVRVALQRAFDRGQSAARIEQAELEVQLSREKHHRGVAERLIRDAEAALLQYERESDSESYAKLRALLKNGTQR